MADTRATLWTFVNVKHVLGKTKFAISVLADSGYRMRDEILADSAKNSNPIHISLLFHEFLLFLLVLLFLLIFDWTEFLLAVLYT